MRSSVRMNSTRMNSHRRPSPFAAVSSAPRGFKIMFGVVSTMVVLTFIAAIGGLIASNVNTGVVENCRVSGKHIAVVDGYSQYRINTANCGSFMIADAPLKGQFSSADVYGQITEGESYDFTQTGFRLPVLSVFPNIVDFEPAGRF